MVFPTYRKLLCNFPAFHKKEKGSMIRISLGGVGSGKTVSEVREMFINQHIKTYSNIITKIKNQITISPYMIVNKEQVDYITKRSGKKIAIYKETLNTEFWKTLEKPISVVLDEAHSIINARRSMSKINIIVTDWIALVRRILGAVESSYGELVFITQLPNRIDIIAREMANQVRYHVCHYSKHCQKCSFGWSETSEIPEPMWFCRKCDGHRIKKSNHVIEIFCFAGMQPFRLWKDAGMNTFYKHYFIKDIEKYFPLYDTLQWENLFSELYV